MHKTFLENRLVVSRSYRWVGDVCAYQGRMEDMSSEILPRWEQSSVSPMVAITGTYTCNTEKAMASHSRTLGWKIPWMEEPGIYGNVYVSALLCQFVPPSPPATVSTSLFYVCASICCPANRFISTIFLDSIHIH